jgi:hypothetical protein
MRSSVLYATLSIAAYAASTGATAVFAHDGHGLGGGSHWHATDVWGFVVVGALSALAVWIARKGK